jgi:hypothetical protein
MTQDTNDTGPQLQIHTVSVNSQSRTLDTRWRLIWRRDNLPNTLDVSQFPHVINSIPSSRNEDWPQVLDWCKQELGPIDERWTYVESWELRFRDAEDATHFRLVFS